MNNNHHGGKMKRSKAILAGTIGTALEYYDTMLYMHFLPLLSPLFFPNEDPHVSSLLGMASFAVGLSPRGTPLWSYRRPLGEKSGPRHFYPAHQSPDIYHRHFTDLCSNRDICFRCSRLMPLTAELLRGRRGDRSVHLFVRTRKARL